LNRVVDYHGNPRAQLDLAGGDHRVALLDSREDRDLVAARAPRRDELLLREERCFPVLALLFFDDEHGVAIGIVGDSGLRQRDKALQSARGDGDGREHAGQQGALRVADGGPYLDVARCRVHLRIDRADLAGELLPGEGVGLEHDPLLRHDFPERLLRRVEIHIHRVERLQRHELHSGGNVLPDVDSAYPQAPREGRAHKLSVHEGLLLSQLCLGALEVRGVRIYHSPAHRLDLQLFPVALVIGFRELDRRRERLQSRQVRFVVELHQRRALLNFLPGLKVNGGNDTGDFGRDVGAAHRPHRSHRLELALPF